MATMIISIPIVIALGVAGYMLWQQSTMSGVVSALVALCALLGARLWLMLVAYCLRSVRHLKECVHVTDTDISYVTGDGTTVIIGWNEPFTLIDRLFHGRVDLVSNDGQRTIRLHRQLTDFNDLIRIIVAKQSNARTSGHGS